MHIPTRDIHSKLIGKDKQKSNKNEKRERERKASIGDMTGKL
jgi:hypothetical protein